MPIPTPHRTRFHSNRLAAAALLPLAVSGCRNRGFPATPAGYREYAYVANSGANTVSVLDLVYLRPDRTLQVGGQPTALAVSPVRDEVYVVNTQSASVSVIDASANRVVATIAVHALPAAIAIDPTGARAFVSNSGAATISVLDLENRREIANVADTDEPGKLRIASDGRTLVVTHRGGNSISIFAVAPADAKEGKAASAPLSLRARFSGCPGADELVILPDASKAFVACSAGHQVMALNLAAAPGSWSARQDPSLTTDRMLALLDVGLTPNHLALKPDGGEIFVANSGSGSISEISTTNDEVGGTSMIGNHPVHGIVSADNSTLFVSNRGDDSIGRYSIDDGKLISSVHTGSAPTALAFSADEHLLLSIDAVSGDVSVIRTQSTQGPNLFTILPAGSSPTAIVTKVVGAHPKP